MTPYIVAFGAVAALVSLPTVIVMLSRPGLYGPFLLTVAIPFFAAGYSAFFASLIGRSKLGVVTAARGCLIALAALLSTLCTHFLIVLMLTGGTTLVGFIVNGLWFSLLALYNHGWYVLPIGASLPWVVRKVWQTHVA